MFGGNKDGSLSFQSQLHVFGLSNENRLMVVISDFSTCVLSYKVSLLKVIGGHCLFGLKIAVEEDLSTFWTFKYI